VIIGHPLSDTTPVPDRRPMALLLRCCRIAGLLSLCLASAAGALPLAGFQHSAWGPRDGAPVDIWALAQAQNGELWLGTGAGLHRFDGVQFRRHELPAGARLASNNITALHFDPDGRLWIGYHSAGISRLDARGILHFSPGTELPRGMVLRFEHDAEGRLWAAVDEGLVYFENGRWQAPSADWAYPGPNAQWLLRDRGGTLWVATGDTVVRLPPRARRFETTGVLATPYAVLAEDRDGRIWLSDASARTRPIWPREAAAPTLPVAAKRLVFDRDGVAWATDAQRGGLRRFADGAAAEYLRQRDGLTSDMAVPILQDREGNLWVGTNLGLNRLRPNDVVPVEVLTDTVQGHFAAFIHRDGEVRLVNGGALFRAERHFTEAVQTGLPTVIGALPDGAGGAWLLGRTGLWFWREGQPLRTVTLPAGRRAGELGAMAPDGEGGLWISVGGTGVFRGGLAGWAREPSVSGEPPSVLAGDGRGGLWMGFGYNEVGWLRQGRLDRFGEDDGLQVGRITAIHAEAGDVLVAGEEGLALRQGSRFQSLAPGQVRLFGGITGIVRSTQGDWWLNGSSGLLRLPARDLQNLLDQPGRNPEVRVFDQHDGLVGVALQARPTPTLRADRHGVLWAATNQGVFWIDPATVGRNPVPPPVIIQGLVAEGRDFRASPGMALPEGVSQVRIDYTATSLSVPERVRFRYRLLGADEQWQEAGPRRQAFYTNLGPGDYTFQVMAANNDGVWNTAGAELAFSISPTFLQSRGFIVACVLMTALLLWLLHLLRLRSLSQRLRERLEERHQERDRIARDLHDTLLQGFQGLMLRFQAVAAEMPATPARARLDQALDRAEQVLGEGRDRVSGLRAELEPGETLAEALSAVGLDYNADGRVDFRVVVDGVPRVLNVVVQDELYLVGREALVNAFRHSGGGTVEVVLRFGDDRFDLEVADNGRGMGSAVLAEGGREGHWGLPGMRERAARIGAVFEVASSELAGTRIRVGVPALRAYRGRRPAPAWALWRRWTSDDEEAER
jgi:signal transduction histidine kinase/ligand-binding sensor domain-containing protein